MSRSIERFIKDEALAAYLRRVADNSPDLAALRERLKAREMSLGAGRARLWPSLSAKASTGGEKQSRSQSTEGSGAGTRQTLGMETSWELDLWGKLRDENHRDSSQYRASEWEYFKAKDALLARAAQEWVRGASVRESLRIVETRVQTLEEIVERVQARYSNGIDVASELDAARTRLMLARAERVSIEAASEESLRRLSAYAGEYCDQPFSGSPNYATIDFPATLTPAEVLFNRPDVQVAMENLNASLYNRRAVGKRLLPGLAVSGNLSKTSIRFEDLLNVDTAWSWALTVSQTLFDAGAVRSERRSAEWESIAAKSELRGVVVNAVLEICSAVAAERKLEQQIALMSEAREASRNSFHYLEKRYLSGLDPIVLMLNGKEEQLSIEAQLNELQAARRVNRIDAILAMGFGLQEREGGE